MAACAFLIQSVMAQRYQAVANPDSQESQFLEVITQGFGDSAMESERLSKAVK